MINIEIKKVKLSELKLNPDNPRTIQKKDMDRLVKSLTEFPEMLEIREIVCDETMTVLGGNMRLQALKRAGAKECIAKIVSGLTEAHKREFVVKDNGFFGDWDMDALANAWGDLPLVEWGVDIPGFNSHELEMTAVGILDLTGGAGENKQTTYDKLADKKGGVLFNFGDIQQSIPFDVYESFYAKDRKSVV